MKNNKKEMVKVPSDLWKEYVGFCIICHRKIDTTKDRYCILKDYNRGKYESECWYHLTCWLDKFNVVREQLQQTSQEWLNKLLNMNSTIEF